MTTYPRFGDLLVTAGLITEEQLSQALEYQKTSNIRLGDAMIALDFVTERQVIEALQMQLGVDFVDLSNVVVPAEMAQLLSKNIARKHGVLPLKVVKDTLFLVMSDPLNFVAVEEVKRATRKKVVPVISTADSIERAIMALYGNEGAARAIEEMRRESGWEAGLSAGPGGADLEDEAQSAPTVRLVNSIIERAVVERASDIHLEPHEEELRVRMRIDGQLRNILPVPKELQNAVISRLKVMGGMDISERRVPQDGRAGVKARKADVDLRMSTLPTIYGEKVVVRLLDKSAALLDKEAIGLAGAELTQYEALLENQSGVILIVGPTGSGKSSTMYTMIRQLNTERVNLVTLEDPVEYDIDGVNQVQINEKSGMTFAGGLRSILRQDPDIIAVGEIRDGETAEIALRAALTGHLVLSTMHTASALGAVDRLMDIGCEPYMISAALRGVISQRLVRKICPHCKTEYVPPAEELESLGLPPEGDYRFYRGAGCPMCFGTGYRGRTGVFEVLVLDSALRRSLTRGGGRDALEDLLKSRRLDTFAENCRRLVTDGVTTAREAARTINSVEL